MTAEIYERRMRVIQADMAEQTALRAVWSSSMDGPRRWLTSCGWTYDPRLKMAHRPFVPWPVQSAALETLVGSIREGRDILVDKSRDMGASWLCLAAFVWFWLFRPNSPLLVASRKEEYVDAKGNPDTLFWKIDYLIARLPPWLRPRQDRRHMHLSNLANGSVIDGESTNADLGRGGRRKAILLDEFAAVENGVEILAATADATPCRVFNSTPKGRGNAFSDVRFSGKVQVVTLHWKDHPTKGKEAAQNRDGAWTSPWYERECARRVSRKEIAQELDIDYLASGGAFFDLDVLQRVRMSGQIRNLLHRGDIIDGQLVERTGGRLALWSPIGGDGKLVGLRNYAAFCDISHGTGASNSVLALADVQTREVVALFVSSDVSPHDFAAVTVAICKWAGGQKPCILGWEANGPGGIFGREVHKLGWGHVLGNLDLRFMWKPEDGKIGWTSTPEEKRQLFGQLRADVARGDIILHDEATVTEMERYIIDKNGTPVCSTVEEDEAGAAHGDRVVATAGLRLVIDQQSMARFPDPPVPVMSLEWRKREAEREEREATQW